jgi:hypothetical protein
MTLRTAALAAIRICVFTFLTLSATKAAELKAETSNAWETYVGHETVRVQKRAANEQGFLWIDADSERYKQTLAGTVVVEPMSKNTPFHVPSGLIHHWIGAVFIPNASIEDVMSVTRDYAHYKDYFKPGVADATPIRTSADKDEFTIRFVNSSVLSRTALEGTYKSDFIRIDDKRAYSVSLTTQIQEIRDAGEPMEHLSAPGEGSGYIWRLYSTARLEEREGGVLLETEAIALSRDIPSALRWFVDPIVKRVSRDSLEKSLSETAEAVHTHAEACAPKTVPLRFGPGQIIVAGVCSRHPGSQHAGYSDFRTQRLAANAGR